MLEQNELNIPAFKRKNNLLARSKQRPISKTTRIKKQFVSTTELTGNIPIDKTQDADDFFANKGIRTKKSGVTEMKLCGNCEGYFEKINVCIIKVTSAIREGDTLLFETDEGLFQQPFSSMQQNRKNIKLARTGSEIGIKTALKPKVGGNIYKII